eukprot:TRINITY_DN48004_c0_g1_i1.p1 TRINITY_DN48004_c0_g1~~TRINITY_DN48004_c0_g1_i1.p1  ORF type:complete len:213 (+),score=36.73 TRINITY_DN48004_c0_g1_i1:143-781(+)
MPIQYACVIESSEVLAEHPPTADHARLSLPPLRPIVQRVASSHFPPTQRKTLTESRFHVHAKASGLRVFLCVATPETEAPVCFGLLDFLEQRCEAEAVTQWPQTIAARLPVVNDKKNQKLADLRADIEATREVMVENIERILERGEKLESLVEQTSTLADEADNFNRSSRRLKQAMCKQHFRLIVIGIIVAVVVFLIILLIACKPNFSRCGA